MTEKYESPCTELESRIYVLSTPDAYPQELIGNLARQSVLLADRLAQAEQREALLASQLNEAERQCSHLKGQVDALSKELKSMQLTSSKSSNTTMPAPPKRIPDGHGPSSKRSATGKLLCLCGHTFKTDAGLKLHLRQAQTGRLFGCDSCPERFFSYSALKYHALQKHQVELPNKVGCRKCGVMVANKREIMDHHRTEHWANK